MKTIVCIALTPAVQRTLHFRALTPGAVNRATRVTVSTGGKGLNVARACHLLGAPVELVVFTGGPTGALIREHLTRDDIPYRAVETHAPSRICQTLMADETTELVEEAACPAPAEWAAFDRACEAALEPAGVLVLAGALMPGAPVDTYVRLIRLAAARRVPVVIDSQGPALLHALAEGVWLAKCNRAELAATLETPVDTTDAMIERAAQWVTAGAEQVLVTDGPRPAAGVRAGQSWRITPPDVQVINPIGSGDSVTAGVVVAHLRGAPLDEAFRHGIACGAANAATPLPAYFEPLVLDELHARTVIEEG